MKKVSDAGLQFLHGHPFLKKLEIEMGRSGTSRAGRKALHDSIADFKIIFDDTQETFGQIESATPDRLKDCSKLDNASYSDDSGDEYSGSDVSDTESDANSSSGSDTD